MRRAIGSYSRYKARRGARAIAPLRLESLELRLTLSHNAPDFMFGMPPGGPAGGQDATPAYFSTFHGDNNTFIAHSLASPDGAPREMLGSYSDGGSFSGAAQFPGGAQFPDGGRFPGAAQLSDAAPPARALDWGKMDLGGLVSNGQLATPFAAYNPPPVRAFAAAPPLGIEPLGIAVPAAIPSHVVDTPISFLITFSFHGEEAPPPPDTPSEYSSHRDGATTSSSPPNSGPSYPAAGDNHAGHPHDVTQGGGPGIDQQPRPATVPAVVSNADPGALAPQAAIDAARRTIPSGTTAAVVPQQPAMPLSLPGEGGVNRIPIGTLLLPQAAVDVTGSPIADVPQSSSESDRAARNETSSAIENPLVGNEEATALAAFEAAADGEAELAANPADRAALLGNLQLNMEAVDQALDAMVSEIERLGTELAVWFDDWTVSNWGTAAAVVVACGLGGRYLWLERGRRSPSVDSEEESSSWLFTRLQSPAGQK